jgi:hypothetical protein
VLVALMVVLALSVGASRRRARPGWSFGPYAGYVWHGRVTSVQSSWTVPRILRGSPIGYGGMWIGAQAPGAPGPAIQIGVDEDDLSAAGGRYYAFWSDTGHHFKAELLFYVKPGDVLSASLRLARERWTFAIVDATSGASARFSTSEGPHAAFNEAEWMQEDPTNPANGKPFPYPRLSAVGFRRLTVDSAAPADASLYSRWMSVNGGNLAPTALHDDSFTLRPATVSAAGGDYLHIVDAGDAAGDAFGAALASWTAKTPFSQIESASSTFVAALQSRIRALASVRWPRQAQGSVPLLNRVLGVLLDQARTPTLLSTAALVAWRSELTRDVGASSDVAYTIARALDVPEITPMA